MRNIILASALAVVAGSAVASQPGFTFDSVVTAASPNTRMSVAVADATGGIYFASNITDAISYLANPLSPTAASEILEVVPGSVPAFGSGSYFGLTIDSNGTLFAMGGYPGAAGKSVLVKITGSGPAGPWTNAVVTLPSPYASATQTGHIRLGGCAAVGPNKIVAPDYNTGSLHFFTITGNTATLDGTVAAPTGFTGLAPSVKYTSGTIFMARATTTSNGGLYTWTSNGTAAGTVNPIARVDNVTGASSTNSVYVSVSYEPTEKVVALNRGGNAAGKQGWAFYNATAPSTLSEYLFLTGGEAGAPGALASADAAMGHTFFKKAGETYFIASNEDAAGTPATGKFLIYKVVPSAVSDWSVY